MAETDENLISLAAGEREEQDGLMCFREDRPGGMFTGSHPPYFYLSCWMSSFTKLPRFSFTSIGASERSNFRKTARVLGGLNLNLEE